MNIENQYIAIPKVSLRIVDIYPMDYLDGRNYSGRRNYSLCQMHHFMNLECIDARTFTWHGCEQCVVRLKGDYSYSNTIVYNNFPWLVVTEKNTGTN
ncbi:MAG: type IIL restriction-modification enzyme MmeI [Lachnospiraceae bacterium]